MSPEQELAVAAVEEVMARREWERASNAYLNHRRGAGASKVRITARRYERARKASDFACDVACIKREGRTT